MAFVGLAILAVSLASAAYEGYQGYEANKAQQQAITDQSSAAQLKAQQESLQRANKIMQVLSTQSNQAASSGIAAGSPSLSAIQTKSLNDYSADQRAAHLSDSLQKKYFSDASAQATGQLYGKEVNAFSSSLVGGLEGYKTLSNLPKTSDTTGSFS